MKPSRGFTLIELAVAMLIITLLLSSILVPLTRQVEQRQISDTRKALDEIKEALIGYAIVNGYLPCPAQSPTNGTENRGAGVCGARAGYIPWVTLGVAKLDAWGHIFSYSVTPAFASSATPFSLTTTPDITIYSSVGAGGVPVSNSSGIPAVVLSHGKNGYGAVNDQGVASYVPANWPASYLDENINANGNAGLFTKFASRVPQGAGAPGAGGEFDDIVVWIPPTILLNRMVAAGKLP